MGHLSDIRAQAQRVRAILAWIPSIYAVPQLRPWIIGIAAIGIVIAVVFAWPLDELGVRVAGMLLQVGGTGVVAVEIVDARKRFGVKGPIDAFRDWLKTRPRNVIIGASLQASSAVLSGAFAVGRRRFAMGPDLSQDERFEAIRKTLDDLHDLIDRHESETSKRLRALDERIEALAKQQSAALAELRDTVKKSETDGLEGAGAALVCIIVGTVLGALPDEIACLAAMLHA